MILIVERPITVPKPTVLEIFCEDLCWLALVKAAVQGIVVFGVGHDIVRLVELSIV